MKLQKLMEICEDAHLAFIITLKITSWGSWLTGLALGNQFVGNSVFNGALL